MTQLHSLFLPLLFLFIKFLLFCRLGRLVGNGIHYVRYGKKVMLNILIKNVVNKKLNICLGTFFIKSIIYSKRDAKKKRLEDNGKS